MDLRVHCSPNPLSVNSTQAQIVYSPGNNFAANKDKKLDACECEKNDEVAKRGPHTASVTGTYSKKLKYDDGVPKELK
jgi:hypothetical protein